MTMILTSGTLIAASITNISGLAAQDILGVGSQGYGLTTYQSFLTNQGNRVSSRALTQTFRDLNTITRHISGSATATISFATGTVITTATFGQLDQLTSWVMANRYQLHPSQRSTYTSSLGVIEDSWWSTSTSRTTLWNTMTMAMTPTMISHRGRVQWATTSLADYFFNSGGDIIIRPTWTTGTGVMAATTQTMSALDNSWLRFLCSGSHFVSSWSYGRTPWVQGATTSYLWGSANTVSVQVSMVKINGRTLDFAVNFSTMVSGGIWYDDQYFCSVQATPAVVDNTQNDYSSAGGLEGLDIQGGDAGQSDGSGGGGGAKVICTELYHQGFLSRDIYLLDQQFGQWLAQNRPRTYRGYRLWADVLVAYMRGQGRPLVPRLMWWLTPQEQQQRSQAMALALARGLAGPFAHDLAHRVDPKRYPPSWAGKIIVGVGLAVCGLLGWLAEKRQGGSQGVYHK